MRTCTNPFHQQLTIRSTQRHRTRLRPRHHRLASGGQKGKEARRNQHTRQSPPISGDTLLGAGRGLSVEVAVDGGAGDAEFGGDLGDGVAALAVVAEFVIHLPGQCDLARPELRLLPAGASAGSGGARPSRVRSDIRACSNSAIAPRIWKNIRPTAVEVSMPWSSTTRSTPAVCSVLGQLDQVLQGAAEPVELGDHQLVPARLRQQGLVELGRRGELAGGLVDEDLVAAGGGEGVVLGLRGVGRGSRPARSRSSWRGAYREPPTARH